MRQRKGLFDRPPSLKREAQSKNVTVHHRSDILVEEQVTLILHDNTKLLHATLTVSDNMLKFALTQLVQYIFINTIV